MAMARWPLLTRHLETSGKQIGNRKERGTSIRFIHSFALHLSSRQETADAMYPIALLLTCVWRKHERIASTKISSIRFTPAKQHQLRRDSNQKELERRRDKSFYEFAFTLDFKLKGNNNILGLVPDSFIVWLSRIDAAFFVFAVQMYVGLADAD